MEIIGRLRRGSNSDNNDFTNEASFKKKLAPSKLSLSFWLTSSRYSEVMRNLSSEGKCPYITLGKLMMPVPDSLDLDIDNSWSQGKGGVMGKVSTIVDKTSNLTKAVEDVFNAGVTSTAANNTLSNILYSQGSGVHLKLNYSWEITALKDPVNELLVPYIMLTSMALPKRLSMTKVQLPGPVFGWKMTKEDRQKLEPIGIVGDSDIINIGIGNFFSLKRVAISKVSATFNTKALTTVAKNTALPIMMTLKVSFTTVVPIMSNDIPGLFNMADYIDMNKKKK